MTTKVQRGETFAGYTDLEVHVCGECGVLFGAPQKLFAARRCDGQVFYCPNGHARVFRESEADRLRRELERERDRRANLRSRLDQTEASLRAARGAATRARNERDRDRRRIAAGVCPCCKRSFANLRRHMTAKHPEFADEQTPEHG